MADRGFKYVHSLLLRNGCQVVRPPSVSSTEKLTSAQVKEGKQIASLRIHIERVIRRIKEYKILEMHACINHKLLRFMNLIAIIVCALVNLQEPLL